MSYVRYMSYVYCMSYVSHVSYVSYVSYISYVNYMNYVSYRGYMKYELCNLYKYFMNHLKVLEITWNHLNCFKYNVFVLKVFDNILFVNIFELKMLIKRNRKQKYWDKILKHMV